ncbi:cytochrome c oxidase-assembly factor cox-23, mitochondrial [Hypoxylon trugodes]|uniref:cytochrome c oxidase-assembly factor cox-23, mitochondrial n=1 Tax=Hypoxylon trugodes TaxID=326681 RepID=UPI002194314A|nr:cytochrome c oxidase-assembly factor cox-23, mitochondrial [Hypoxylon trugodes]KAI1390381.1 cytochrome c oxidase-assembly factor cox-23, mitochondrial [Hypoxylon trugodes]
MSSQTESGGDPWNKDSKRKFENKSKSEFFDPCQEAAARSIRCLNRNGGDRQMCTDYFEAYRACKKEWVNKRKQEGGGFFNKGS